MEWGDLLRVSQRGMWASRRFLWDEAARNIAALLACPSAWDGDHFLQVAAFRIAALCMVSCLLAQLRGMYTKMRKSFHVVFYLGGRAGLQTCAPCRVLMCDSEARCAAESSFLMCKVSEWIQRILTIGAAFAGADGAKGLRRLLTAQAENFFRCIPLCTACFANGVMRLLQQDGYNHLCQSAHAS